MPSSQLSKKIGGDNHSAGSFWMAPTSKVPCLRNFINACNSVRKKEENGEPVNFQDDTVLTYAEQKFDLDSKQHGPRPDNEVMHTS